MYWTDVRTSQIMRSTLDGLQETTLLSVGLELPGKLQFVTVTIGLPLHHT